MKVAITGKGGVGKTTLSSTLARLYADEGRTVLCADVDPDANLGLALGLSQEEVDVAWIIYTLYHSLWFSRIVYSDGSLEQLVNNKDYTSANHLLEQMLSDMI